MTDKEFLMLLRQSFLAIIDAIERKLNVSPRTAELRKLKGNPKGAPIVEVDDGCSDGNLY